MNRAVPLSIDAAPPAVFAEPWQAHAFALAVRLAEKGLFTWPEWTSVLAEEIQSAQKKGDPDLGATYYHHWLTALERLCTAKGLVGGDSLRLRKEAWRQAYLATPHGQPVLFPRTEKQQSQ